MASRRKYGYYLKGNKIALIEEGTGSGVCSLSGYSSQTTCEAAGGTWTENAISTNDGEYRSPVATVANGLEIQYAYSPTYTLPDIQLKSSTNAAITKFHLQGWIVVDGYLTLVRSGQAWSNMSKVDVNDYIYIGGSEKWNGVHKVQEIQDSGDVTHGGIKTYTRAIEDVGMVIDDGVSWVDDETITGLATLSMSSIFTDSDTTPYIWIMGSDANILNNGMFSGWSFSGHVLTLTTGKRHSFTTSIIEEDEITPVFTADSSEDLYIYKGHSNPNTYFITDVEVLQDESFELDLSRYQANAVVYYLKAKMAEDAGDMDKREFFLREFKRQLEKGNSALKRGPYMVQGFKEMR